MPHHSFSQRLYSTVVCIKRCTTKFSETCLVVLSSMIFCHTTQSVPPCPCPYTCVSPAGIAPRNSEDVRDCILASHDEVRYLQEMADLASCSLHTLKASENRLRTTFRILFKHDQICFQKFVVQTIMQTTVSSARSLLP